MVTTENVDQAWLNWNTSTASSTTSLVWANWNVNTTSTGTTWVVDQDTISVINESEVEQYRIEERVLRRQQEEARARQLEEAEERANVLLRELLDDQQWESWMLDHAFETSGSLGGHYKIRRGYQGNVLQIDDQGEVIASFCIHPPMYETEGRLPNTDAVIAQLLTLLTDEAEFRRIANITPRNVGV